MFSIYFYYQKWYRNLEKIYAFESIFKGFLCFYFLKKFLTTINYIFISIILKFYSSKTPSNNKYNPSYIFLYNPLKYTSC
jgi:hypothetical protein